MKKRKERSLDLRLAIAKAKLQLWRDRVAALKDKKPNSPKFKKMSDQQLLLSRIRYMPVYSEWRRKVFERDAYTCKSPNCGKKGIHRSDEQGKAEAEARFEKPVILFAIRKDNKPLHEILASVGITEADQAYEVENHPELWNIDNAYTICSRCFAKTKPYK